MSAPGRAATLAVVGATGYSGGELCRLLLGHPAVGEIIPTSREEQRFDRAHPNLLGCGLELMRFEDLLERRAQLDVAFFCTPAGEAMQQAPQLLESGVRVIDLSPDFRFADVAAFEAAYGIEHASPELLHEAVYGVSELRRAEIADARLVANPGCYVITGLLGLAPLMSSDLLDEDETVHIHAVNGTTGAGSSLRREIMHPEVFGSVLPYSMEGHRHGPELEEQLAAIAGRPVQVSLSTAHGAFARGIYLQASLRARADRRAELGRDRLLDVYRRFYGAGHDKEHFVLVDNTPKSGGLNAKDYSIYPSVANVTGSNFCHIGADYDPARGIAKVISVTDNLVKGAAGSAVQNMNLMLGFSETAGLDHYGL
jgi:N-acetyl-gamma-glutamyl-phosphate reductase common form